MPEPQNPSYWGDRLRIRHVLDAFRRFGGQKPNDPTIRLHGAEVDEVRSIGERRAGELKSELADPRRTPTLRMTAEEKAAWIRKAQAEAPTEKIPGRGIQPNEPSPHATQRWNKDELDVAEDYAKSFEKGHGPKLSESGGRLGAKVHPAERIKLGRFDQFKMRMQMRGQSMFSTFRNIGWKKFALSGLAGMAIGTLAFMAFDYARDRVLEKISDNTDLTMLLPQNNPSRISMAVPFVRVSREVVPQAGKALPFVVEEKLTLTPPSAGNVWAFGVSLSGLPVVDDNDIDVNGAGDGKSDWLCQPFAGYMVCRTTSGATFLDSAQQTVLTLRFSLPSDEMRKLLAVGAGSADGYVLVLDEKR